MEYAAIGMHLYVLVCVVDFHCTISRAFASESYIVVLLNFDTMQKIYRLITKSSNSVTS